MPRTLHVLLYDQLPGEWRRDPLTIAQPFFAAPYFTLGRVLEARGLGQQALAAYRDYVQRAPSLAPLVPRARARIAALSGMEPDSARQP